jgi:hypothetical protein
MYARNSCPALAHRAKLLARWRSPHDTLLSGSESVRRRKRKNIQHERLEESPTPLLTGFPLCTLVSLVVKVFELTHHLLPISSLSFNDLPYYDKFHKLNSPTL